MKKKIDFFGINPTKKRRTKPFKFRPVKLATKKNVRKVKRKNLTWPQAVKRYPKVTMFGDADKDGKLNMFDCKPFDKKRHGWITKKQYKDSTVIHMPVNRLYYARGRYSMDNVHRIVTSNDRIDKKVDAVHKKRVKVLLKKWEDSVDVWQDKDWPDTTTSRREVLKEELKKEGKKLEKKGYKVRSLVLDGSRYRPDAYVKYGRGKKAYGKAIKAVMTPCNTSDMGGGNKVEGDPAETKDDHRARARTYVTKLAKAIKSDKPEVPMLTNYAYYLDRGSTRLGEGRHRILAAKKAGEETIPVEIVTDTTYSPEKKIKALVVQEGRDFADGEPAPGVLADFDFDEEGEAEDFDEEEKEE